MTLTIILFLWNGFTGATNVIILGRKWQKFRYFSYFIDFSCQELSQQCDKSVSHIFLFTILPLWNGIGTFGLFACNFSLRLYELELDFCSCKINNELPTPVSFASYWNCKVSTMFLQQHRYMADAFDYDMRLIAILIVSVWQLCITIRFD